MKQTISRVVVWFYRDIYSIFLYDLLCQICLILPNLFMTTQIMTVAPVFAFDFTIIGMIIIDISFCDHCSFYYRKIRQHQVLLQARLDGYHGYFTMVGNASIPDVFECFCIFTCMQLLEMLPVILIWSGAYFDCSVNFLSTLSPFALFLIWLTCAL